MEKFFKKLQELMKECNCDNISCCPVDSSDFYRIVFSFDKGQTIISYDQITQNNLFGNEQQ